MSGRVTTPHPAYDVYHRGSAAIITEIYLPQKYALSPEVVTALTASVNPIAIRKHFSLRTRGWTRAIQSRLGPKLQRKYERVRKRLLRRHRCAFGGYSIATIGGAFRDAHRVEYDANAVIRIIDWPTPEELGWKGDEDFFQRVVRTVFGLRRHYDHRPSFTTFQAGLVEPRRDGKDDESVDKQRVREICDALENWMDEHTLILQGFLMFHLIRATRGHETAIMITSHSAVVHQYTKRRRSRAKGH